MLVGQTGERVRLWFEQFALNWGNDPTNKHPLVNYKKMWIFLVFLLLHLLQLQLLFYQCNRQVWRIGMKRFYFGRIASKLTKVQVFKIVHNFVQMQRLRARVWSENGWHKWTWGTSWLDNFVLLCYNALNDFLDRTTFAHFITIIYTFSFEIYILLKTTIFSCK